MINKKVDEAVFDALLEQALADVIEEDIKKLQEEDTPCSISAEADQRIRKMIAQAGKKNKQIRVSHVIRAAAVVLVVLLNVSLIGLLMIPSVSAEVKNVFTNLFDEYASFETIKNNHKVITTSEYEIGYIPDGFELVLNDDDHIRFREQDGGDGYIVINISVENFGRTSLDSEYEKFTGIKINGMDAELHRLGEDYTLFWYDGYHFVSILSNVPEEVVIKIANNIKKFQ